MEGLIDLSNPVYLGICVILLILLVFALVKKIIKLVITAGAILFIYVIYLMYTEQDIPEDIDTLRDSVSKTVEKSIDEVKESTSDDIPKIS